MKKKLLDYLNGVLSECCDTMENTIAGDEERFKKIVGYLNYTGIDEDRMPGPSREVYMDPVFGSYYLTRYGLTYAFEYSVLYEALLKAMTDNGTQNKPALSMMSIGCGSMLDAWSLAYERSRLEGTMGEKLESMKYYGFDGAKWGICFSGSHSPNPVDKSYFVRDAGGGINVKAPWLNRFAPDGAGPDICDIFSDPNSPVEDCNVFSFPRILNELLPKPREKRPVTTTEFNNSKLGRLVVSIEQAAGNNRFTKDVLYICISHGKSSIDPDEPYGCYNIADRIVKAINYNNAYEVKGDVLEQSFLMSKDNSHKDDGLKLETFGTHDETHKFYGFKTPNKYENDNGDVTYSGEYVYSLNTEFKNDATINSLKEFDKNHRNYRGYKNWMSRSTYTMLQLIELKRK